MFAPRYDCSILAVWFYGLVGEEVQFPCAYVQEAGDDVVLSTSDGGRQKMDHATNKTQTSRREEGLIDGALF